MSSYTPKLGLVKQGLEDYADERTRNKNWDIIDSLFHVTEGHKHDGVDSPLIDLDAIWRAIEELRAITKQLRIDITELDIREWEHYLEYLRHKHYALDTPPSVETHWFDTFQSFRQINQIFTTASITPQQGLLHLPRNYNGNHAYYMVSKPFNLSHTLEELTRIGMADAYNQDVQPDQAVARIFMARKGIVTPYIAIGNNLEPSNAHPRKYPGALVGVQTAVTYVDNFIKSKLTFENKRREVRNVPHVAWHHVDTDRPPISRYVYGFGPQQRRWDDRIEFETDQYERITRADGDEVVTSPRYQDADPIYETVPQNIDDPRVLYHADKALAWHKKQNRFYWYNANANLFIQIPNEDIGPLRHENLVKVAAGLDRDNWIWVMKTYLIPTENPAGHFIQMHQIVKWDGFSNFEERKTWASGRHRRKHWPANVIAPDRLEIDNDNIYAITSLGFNDGLAPDGENVVNYYDSNGEGEAHDAYQWFPFQTVYGDAHKGGANVNYVKFNPGILGTVHKISRRGDWVAEGPSKIISGAYRPNANRWATSTDEQINDFEGGNDSVYLGTNGEELFFYQAFVPYNGADIHRNERYKNADFRESNPDEAWHGIIAHNVATGINRFIRGNIPFRVNVGGGVELEGGTALITGGTELVKQFVTPDFRILSTVNNQPPQNESIIYSYWVDRHIPGVITYDRLSVRDDIVNPIKIDLDTGLTERIVSHADDTSLTTIGSRTQSPQVVMNPRGFSAIGGKNIRNREALRLRRIDGRVRKIVGWSGALETGSKARQIYSFEIGEGVTERDIVKVHIKARSEGKPTANPLDTASRMRDIDVMDWRWPDWGLLGRIANGDGGVTFVVKDLEWISQRRLIFMIENQRTTDRRAKIASKLFVDYCYVTVERQGYVYEYNWDSLPNGNQGAVVLECQSGTRQGLNPGTTETVSNNRDIQGVEVESVDVSIISNREG